MTLIGSLGVLLIQASQQPQHFPGQIWEVRRGQGPSCTASLSYMISARSSLSSSRGQSTAEVLNWFLKHLLVHWLTGCKLLLISSLSFNYHKVLNDSIPHMLQWLMVKYLLLTKLGLNPLISEGSLAIGANGSRILLTASSDDHLLAYAKYHSTPPKLLYIIVVTSLLFLPRHFNTMPDNFLI